VLPRCRPIWQAEATGSHSTDAATDPRLTASSGVFHSCDDVESAVVWGSVEALDCVGRNGSAGDAVSKGQQLPQRYLMGSSYRCDGSVNAMTRC